MAIYRGPGGPGDAITDAANEATVASNKATEAAASAAAASASESAAASSASSASSSASAASSSASAAASSASSASSSASSAASSASSASSSASSATVSATAASASETAAETAQAAAEAAQAAAELAQTGAETAETNAETAQSAAEAARDAALAALDSFDDRYLGTKTSDPTLDNDGNALVAGALYFNSVSNIMKVYTGSAWVAAYVSGSLDLDSLTDVVLTSVTTGQLLKYDGTNWVNGTVTTDLVGDTTPQLGGALDTNGYAINFGDNDKATFGDSEDLWLYHDGGTSYLYDRGTGNLRIITNSTVSIDGASGGEFMAQFVTNGAVSLYYDNSNKFQTTSTGINVNGNIAVSGTVDGVDIATGATNWDTAYGWGNHASAGYLTSYTETDPVFVASPAYGITGTKISNWDDSYTFVAAFPTQTGQSGKFLTTDGSSLSFAAVDALPDQTGNSGKFLTTDGTDASWAAIETGNVTTAGIWEHSATISANYTISSGNNAMSAGPITVASGVTVTVPSGSTWVII